MNNVNGYITRNMYIYNIMISPICIYIYIFIIIIINYHDYLLLLYTDIIVFKNPPAQ